jgi:hypothetical protein
MSLRLVNPRREQNAALAQKASRLGTLAGKTIALLDISKPGGAVFLDRLAVLLTCDYGVNEVVRETKPTFAKPAPADLIERLRERNVDAVIEALAD